MCGIIGFTGRSNAVKKVVEGLFKLEYRGYDSCGISYFDDDGNIVTQKTEGRVKKLGIKLDMSLESFSAIGHTRWATHGEASSVNAHPHNTETLSLVHNGIIENYS